MLANAKKIAQTMVYALCLAASVSAVAGEARRAPASALSVITDRKLRNFLPAVPIYSYGLTGSLPATGQNRIRNTRVLNFDSEYGMTTSGRYITRSPSVNPTLPQVFSTALKAPASP